MKAKRGMLSPVMVAFQPVPVVERSFDGLWGSLVAVVVAAVVVEGMTGRMVPLLPAG